MRLVGFIGPSYKLGSVNVDCQRCINLYPELDELGTGKEQEVASLVGTPGLSAPLVTIGTGPIRAEYVASNGAFYVASGTGVYVVSSSYSATLIATLTTNSGSVSMADNGLQIVIVDGSTTGFWSTLGTTTSTQFTYAAGAGSFQGAARVSFMNSHFLFDVPGTSSMYASDLNAVTFAQLIEFAAETTAEPIVSHIVDHQNLWIFKTRSIEIYYDDGVTPFSPVSGAYIELGCAAGFSVAKADNTLFWLGADDKGHAIVYMASGYSPVRVSTHAVELAINSYSNISAAAAYAYQQNGHVFYVLNFPSADTTWVYDVGTKLWHERAYLNNGVYQRHLAQTHAFFNGIHVVGDYQNGNLYQLSDAVYTDNGSALVRRRVAPHITKDLKRLFYHSLQIDMETGVGLDGLGQGTAPQVILRFSDDGGHSWSNEKWTSMGLIGQTKARAMWRRLGQSRDRVFEVTISDPVPVRLIGATVHLNEGAS